MCIIVILILTVLLALAFDDYCYDNNDTIHAGPRRVRRDRRGHDLQDQVRTRYIHNTITIHTQHNTYIQYTN